MWWVLLVLAAWTVEAALLSLMVGPVLRELPQPERGTRQQVLDTRA